MAGPRAGIEINVDLFGGARLSAWMDRAQSELEMVVLSATEKATDVTADAIIAVTPERSGRLRQSWKTKVTRTLTGVEGRVTSSLRYAPFVNFGTRQHGRAQKMTQRGVAAAKPDILDIYRREVDAGLASLG